MSNYSMSRGLDRKLHRSGLRRDSKAVLERPIGHRGQNRPSCRHKLFCGGAKQDRHRHLQLFGTSGKRCCLPDCTNWCHTSEEGSAPLICLLCCTTTSKPRVRRYICMHQQHPVLDPFGTHGTPGTQLHRVKPGIDGLERVREYTCTVPLCHAFVPQSLTCCPCLQMMLMSPCQTC